MIEDKQTHRKMKQVVFEFLTNEIEKEQAVGQLMDMGYTQLEAVFELNHWELSK